MIRALFLVAVCTLSGCMGGGCNVPPPPTSETCDNVPNAAPIVDRIDIGYITFERFELIEPDAAVPLVTGGQGSDMVVAALRITGSNLSDCVAQSTELSFDGEPMSSETAPLRATQLSPAVWQTGAILLPWYGPSGQLATLTSTVSNETATVDFWVQYMNPDIVDAMVPPDAWVQDDAPNIDATTLDAVDPGADAAPDA